MFGQHGTFIIACYAATVLVLGAMALWIFIDGRTLRRTLAELESRGVRRRSAGREDLP